MSDDMKGLVINEEIELNYPCRMNKDFDSRKLYEDTVLTILNDFSRSPITNPSDSHEYR